MSRRSALAAGAPALPLVRIRTVGAARKLSVGFSDGRAPGASGAMHKLVAEFGAKTKTDAPRDFIISTGDRPLLMRAAEPQHRRRGLQPRIRRKRDARRE